MTPQPRYDLETDPDRIAARAMCVVTDLRDVDLRFTFDTLTGMCADEPARMAQVIMCLAAWINPDDTTQTLAARAEAITVSRVARRAPRAAA